MSVKEILKARELESRGHHKSASAIYQREGNKERPVAEKNLLWDLAEETRHKGR